MQPTCPKCNNTAFRMLPDAADRQTDMECLHCGHVTAFVTTVTRPPEEPESPEH